MNLKPAFLLLFTFCVFNTSRVNAQAITKGSSLISMGHGFPNLPALIVSDWGENGSKGFGPYTFAYQYALSRFFIVGVQLGYVGAVSNPTAWESTNSTGGAQTLYYSLDMRIFTAMVKADMHYRKRGRRGDLYSSVAAGYGFIGLKVGGHADPDKESLKISGLVYSVAWGYRYMITDAIGIYSEAGYGLMGFANSGLTLKVGGEKRNWWQR